MPQKKKTTQNILPFTINDRWYALPVDQVEGVTRLSQSTSIPGNRSRALVGLGYMLGQLMTVVDCAPIMNIGVSRGAEQVIITRHQGAYYALLAGQIGQIIASPKLVPYKRPLTSCTQYYVDYQKKKITRIEVARLIEDCLCK